MPTGTCTWRSPAANSELAGVIELKFDIVDTAGSMTGFALYANGVLLSNSLTILSGNSQSGTLYYLWDTRKHSQGSVTLKAVAVGSDDAEVYAELAVSVENSHTSGTLYRDYRIASPLATTREYHRAHLQMWAGPLAGGVSQRFWLRAGMYTDDAVSVVDEETDPAVAQATFDDMQQVALSLYKDLNGNGKVYSTPNGVTLETPDQDLFVRIQLTPRISQLVWETGSEKVYKIRKVEEGVYAVFCRSNDQVYLYDGSELTSVVDLTDVYGFIPLDDMCLREDKLYYMIGGVLCAYDTDSSDDDEAKVMTISPAREGRSGKWLETVGASVIALFVDIDDETSITQAYALVDDQFDQIWQLDAEPEVVWTDGSNLYLGCGPKLYKSSAGTGTPVLMNSSDFQDDIISIGPGAVGLADGSMWVYVGTSWVEYVDESFTSTVQAIEGWFGALETYHYLFGAGDAVLREQSPDGSFGDTLTLPPPEIGDLGVDAVISMCRYVVGDTSNEGEGFKLPDEERMLIGTELDGLFFDVQVSRLDETAAIQVTTVDDLIGVGTHRSVLA